MMSTVSLTLGCILLSTVAKPWSEAAAISPVQEIPSSIAILVVPDEDLNYGEDDDDLSKRFSINSYRLFHPFYHNRGYVQPQGSVLKRNGNSLNELITRLLAMKGGSQGGKVASVRFGPGGK